MIRFVDAHRATYGVEPICHALQVAPSSYYAARSRPPSARSVRDVSLGEVIAQVHAANFGVYGVRKLWLALGRLGIEVGRDRVGRLMHDLGLVGATRGRRVRTTRPDPAAARPGDLVRRAFTAAAPNRLWVADITYVPIRSGFCYAAFVVDAFSRRIVGWRVLGSLHAGLALDALEMAIFARAPDEGLVHHSDRGSQYLSIRYTERLAEIAAAASVGSRGDSYDNALAETVNGLYKAELIHRRGPWATAADVEYATAAWVDFWNTRRLHSACGDRPPAEYEAAYDREHRAAVTAA